MHKLGATDEALGQIKPIRADQVRTSWSVLASGTTYQREPSKALLTMYDRDDERIRHSDADLLAEQWPGAVSIKTGGYGHKKILRAPETLAAVTIFVAA